MKAMVIDTFGGPEVLHWAELPKPQPGPGEVLVRVACASVNPADWKTREGMLSKYIEYHFPFVLGFDLAGTVETVGDGVTGFAPGDRVFGTSRQGMGGNGSYAEYTLAAPAMLQPMPPGVAFADAAALPTIGSTAYGAIFDVGALKAGQTLLLNGGAGGVGSVGIQMARATGARVAVTCSPGNDEYVRALGADLAIDYRQGVEHIVAAVQAWAPGGVDLVVDAVGLGSLVDQAVRLVRPGGSFIEIETLFPEASDATRAAAAEKGVRITSNMIAVSQLPDQLRGVAEMVAAGKVRAPALEVVPLGEVAQAQRRVQEGHVRGKIVLQVAASEQG